MSNRNSSNQDGNPQEGKSGGKRKRDLFDYLQWGATFIIALFGVYLHIQQNSLKEAQNNLAQQQVIQGFSEKLISVAKDIDLEPSQNEVLWIELMRLFIELNLPESDMSGGDQNAQLYKERLLIPYRLALATGNYQAVAHGSNLQTIVKDGKSILSQNPIWLDYAKNSNSNLVRITSIEAISLITMNSVKVDATERIKWGIREIMVLSRNLSDSSLREPAAKAIKDILNMEESIKIIESEDEEFEELLSDVSEILKAQGIRSELARLTELSVEEKSSELNESLLTLDLVEPLARSQNQVQEPVDYATAEENDITRLLSDNVETRRGARDRLAKRGNDAIPDLLNALDDEELGSKYRIRLGVAYVLYSMDQQISIDKQSPIEKLVDLIGDSNKVVRQYASEFLMKLSDRETVERLYEEFQKIMVPTQQNENELYNAVVVVGTWARILPDELHETKTRIKEDLTELKRDLDKKKWPKTIRLIDEMLKMAA